MKDWEGVGKQGSEARIPARWLTNMARCGGQPEWPFGYFLLALWQIYPLSVRLLVNNKPEANILRQSLLISLLPLSGAALAADVQPEMIITADRVAITAEETLASVSVITREQIDAWQVDSLGDLLRRLPGVNISQSGGAGQPTSLYLRGSNFNHTLVLIDGIKMGSASLGSPALHQFPVGAIERIEVVRGPRSGLYGAEAIGGVIQIFTRKGQGKPHLNAEIGGGTEQSYRAQAHLSAEQDNTAYSLTVGHEGTEGENACDGAAYSGCFTDEPDNDGHRNSHFGINLRQQLSQRLSVGVQALRSQGHTEFDSSYQNEVDYVQQMVGLHADWQVMNPWSMHLSLGESRDETDNFGNNNGHSIYDTRRSQVTWQNDVQLSDEQSISLGYEFLQDKLDSDSAYTENQRENNAGFLGYRYLGDKLDISAAARLDDNEQFGQHSTGQIALGYALRNDVRAFISYGTGFRAPTFNELYYPGFGNPDLDPERSRSYELGFKGQWEQGNWSASAYQTRIKDLIATNYNASTGAYLPENINEAKIKGVELTADWRWQDWLLSGQYTWLQARDQATGNDLPRRAEHQATLDLARQWQRWTFGGTLLVQSHRYDNSSNSVNLSGYGVLNLRAEYRWNANWRVQAKVDNVFDREYETTYRYPMSGRSAFLSIHYATDL